MDTPYPSLEERFEAFHRANPQVYRALVSLCIQLRDRGVRRYSMKGLFEVLRWSTAMETGGGGFKLDNGFTAFYARLIMDRLPQLEGFFETRQRQSEAA